MADDASRRVGDPPHAPLHADADALLAAIMRRQARLSVGVALVFLVLVLGLPLVNECLAGLAQTRIGGFSATWLFLGVLFYPITWLLSAYFVRASETVERETAALAHHEPGRQEDVTLG
jgi:uncharacterized membrane protein (DUF485 family)